MKKVLLFSCGYSEYERRDFQYNQQNSGALEMEVLMETNQADHKDDVLCSVCGGSTCHEGNGPQFGTLSARWGHGSAHDGECYEVRLCEPCFFGAVFHLRRERMVSIMFSDEDQDLSHFGRLDSAVPN